MKKFRVLTWFALAVSFAAGAAQADSRSWDYNAPRVQKWSVTLYAGPQSNKYFGAVMQDFNLQSRGVLIGLALDRKLINFGSDIYLAAELQGTHVVMDHPESTVAFMLGFEIDRLFGYERTSFAAFTGPSYSFDPPYRVIGYKHRTYPTNRTQFLNAVAFEFASGLPGTQNWDWTFRFYHRSGVFGLYSEGDDDGLAFGLGLRRRF